MRRLPDASRRTDDGLTRWIADDEPLENTDVVLWYVFGIHHITRVEDWPIMPVDTISFWLKPFGFFDRNPSIDVPPSMTERPATTATPVPGSAPTSRASTCFGRSVRTGPMTWLSVVWQRTRAAPGRRAAGGRRGRASLWQDAGAGVGRSAVRRVRQRPARTPVRRAVVDDHAAGGEPEPHDGGRPGCGGGRCSRSGRTWSGWTGSGPGRRRRAAAPRRARRRPGRPARSSGCARRRCSRRRATGSPPTRPPSGSSAAGDAPRVLAWPDGPCGRTRLARRPRPGARAACRGRGHRGPAGAGERQAGSGEGSRG